MKGATEELAAQAPTLTQSRGDQPTDLAPLTTIRTETIFSRLPIHNLSKKGSVNIHITKKNDQGEIELLWSVSPSRNYGEPRQLAYKLDTLIINRRIDEAGRPLPKMLRLDTQRQIFKTLGLRRGKTTDLRIAHLQNASAFITAKLTYKGKDGTEKRLEAGFTRYSVIFTGEKLPDGGKADAVYLVLNDIYQEVLNNAPVRPLNYDYLKALPPAGQRFYELISFKIFASIKYKLLQAKMLYSEYCTFSGQQRYYDYNHFKKQMYKVHKPHLASGYLAEVSYEPATDTEGNPDWGMLYTPGPKAHAEYRTFNKKHLIETGIEPPESRGEEIAVELPRAKDPLTLQAEDLVKHFYNLFHHNGQSTSPTERELNQARSLITAHGLDQAHFIIDYAHRVAPETNYTPKTFGGILTYEKTAIEEHHKEQARQRWHEAIASCPLCDAAGWTTYEDQSGYLRMGKCPHDLQAIRTYESKTGLTWKGV